MTASKLETAPADVNQTVAQENQDAITISSDGVVKGKLAELNTYTSTNPAQ